MRWADNLHVLLQWTHCDNANKKEDREKESAHKVSAERYTERYSQCTEAFGAATVATNQSALEDSPAGKQASRHAYIWAAPVELPRLVKAHCA